MRLHITIGLDHVAEPVVDDFVTDFDQQEKIGVRCGRLVRDWLRQVPHRRDGDSTFIRLEAEWDQSEPPAPRKAKRGKKAAENDDGD
jgi:hypothetical protein